MQSTATSVDQYLAELPEPRRTLIAGVRDMVNRHIPKGYRESMCYGMIGWSIPLEHYPNTYNGQPLGYVALAAQKRHNALYLMAVYADSLQERTLRGAYAERGLKLDMGKCCLRFSDKAAPPEDLLGPLIASMSVEQFIATYEAARAAPRQKPAGKAKAGSSGSAAGTAPKPARKTAAKTATTAAKRKASGSAAPKRAVSTSTARRSTQSSNGASTTSAKPAASAPRKSGSSTRKATAGTTGARKTGKAAAKPRVKG